MSRYQLLPMTLTLEEGSQRGGSRRHSPTCQSHQGRGWQPLLQSRFLELFKKKCQWPALCVLKASQVTNVQPAGDCCDVRGTGS